MLVSSGMYLLTQYVGNFLIERNYLNEQASHQRLTDYQESFKKYVSKNHVSVKNVRAISKWVKNQKYVYLIISDKDEIIYESGFWDERYSSSEIAGTSEDSTYSNLSGNDTAQTDINEEFDQAPYEIKFRDGIYSVIITDSSEVKWHIIVKYVSLAFFFFYLFLILIIYNHRIIARIMRLSGEVSLIEKGDLEQPIYQKGNDEISLLAENADNMRNSIITRYQSEKEAWEANSELITSMSHDIRTPLTSLIGYLEILNAKNYHSEEQFDRYIKSCMDKSIQLKDLSDKMFQYFLVFGKEKIEMQMEAFDFRILFQQLLYEHVFDLNNSGFTVKTEFVEQSCIIYADIQYLKRLFDNLFSNIKKYASINGQVNVIGFIKNNHLLIDISNEIRQDSVLLESTNIGLKTCKKIVEQMNGIFEAYQEQSHFVVRIIFPIERNREE
jgi:signal transduction histidine kinase